MSRAVHKMRPSGGFTFALTATDTTQNDTDSPSFASMNAGNPNAGRILIAVITCIDDDAEDDTFWPTTCTIGGVTADRDIFIDSGDALPTTYGVAIYSAVVPEGATVTVDITIGFLSGTMDDWACALFRATSINKTPVDTDQSVVSIDLDTSSAKFAVFGAVERSGAPGNWTGGGNTQLAVAHGNMTIGYDDAPLGGATDTYSTIADRDAIAGAAYG